MQLVGSEFMKASAMSGNDLSTLPDYPAEIRAPAGTTAGVSGFQIQLGSREIFTPGDQPDVLVAMNPAAQKTNLADLKVGGAHTNRVEIATPRYEKVTIGVDDTDNKEGGATWVTALKAQKIAAALPGIQALNLRLIQLCPRSPNKTTNCVASAITFAVKPEAYDALIASVVGTVRADNRSEDPGIAVYRGIGIPRALNDFGWEIKKRLVTMEEVNRGAEENGVEFIDILGPQAGRIGALAAVALSEERTDAAALYEDKALPLIRS
jgi:methanogenesis imperfect marker protein 11